MFERIFSSDYRLEVIARMVAFAGASHQVYFDDIEWAVPPAQRRELIGLPGYQRMLWLAAAASCVTPVTVILRAPLLKGELKQARVIRDKLGCKNSFRVLLPLKDGRIVDLFSLAEADLDDIFEYFEGDNFQGNFSFFDFIKDQRELVFAGSKSLVLPFQTRKVHYDKIGFFDEVVLLSPAEKFNDKNKMAKEMKRVGLERYVTQGQEIPSNGNLREISAEILKIVDLYHQSQLTPYIKGESDGVSGIANISIRDLKLVLDKNTPLSFEKRVEILEGFLRKRGVQAKSGARVEVERTPMIDQFGPKELTVAGESIDSVIYPTYIGRMIVEDGIFKGMIHSDDFSVVNLEDEVVAAEEMLDQLNMVFDKLSYQLGYVAFDIIPNHDFRVNDYNFRRGGRTAGDVVLFVFGGQFYDKEYLVPANNFVDAARKVTWLENQGILVYSSSLIFFPEEGKVKVKVLIPLDYLNKADIHASAEEVIKNITQ